MSNTNLVLEFIERVWNKHEMEHLADYLDEEYTIELDNGDPWEGKILDHDEFRRRLQYSFSSFPDMHFALQTVISDGDSVAIGWILTGTNLGSIGTYPPTGKKIRASGMTIYRLQNGKICGHIQVLDRTTVMKQLGYIT
ncbi:MAG TPA: ester cyclase [Bacteroidota bacterium]|nr:ester cyclase [Bacteroidota bacterium]